MRKIYILSVLMLSFVLTLSAQNIKVKQVIIASGGNYSDPDDYVTLATYNPEDSTTTQFGTIYTQSVQCAVIRDHILYVAAQDSIVSFDIDNYQRVAAVEAPGVNQLAVADDKLVASFWYPDTSDFVKIYNRDDLSFIAAIPEITGECAGIVVYENTAFVAVPGSYGDTTGSIAAIDLNTNTFIAQINLGEEGARINDLYLYQKIYKGIQETYVVTINKSDWNGNTGYIMKLNISDYSYEKAMLDVNLGKGVGIKLLNGGTLYAVMNGGIGAISLVDLTISETTIVPAPLLSIADAQLDKVNDLFYVTVSDYYSMGEGKIYNIDGDIAGSFDAGIAAEAIAIDYRNNDAIDETSIENKTRIFPNPASGYVNIMFTNNEEITKVVITNLTGQTVLSKDFKNLNKIRLNISSLNSGLYLMTVYSNNTVNTSKIIKK